MANVEQILNNSHSMKTQAILDELLALAATAGYKVIRDKGRFRGGACVVREQKIIVLNKRLPAETIITILARALADAAEGVFVKPAVRSVIERENNAKTRYD